MDDKMTDIAEIEAQVRALVMHCVEQATYKVAKNYAGATTRGAAFPSWVTYLQIQEHCPTVHRDWLKFGLVRFTKAGELGTVYTDVIKMKSVENAKFYLLECPPGMEPSRGSLLFKKITHTDVVKQRQTGTFQGFLPPSDEERFLALGWFGRNVQKRNLSRDRGALPKPRWGGNYAL